MTGKKFVSWQLFTLATQTFLENRKAENNPESVEDKHFRCKNLDVKVNIKVYYLFTHLDCFPENLGDLSEEHGERYHYDIMVMESGQVECSHDNRLLFKPLQ